MKFTYAIIPLIAAIAAADTTGAGEIPKPEDFQKAEEHINSALSAIKELGQTGSNVPGLDLQTLNTAKDRLQYALGDISTYKNRLGIN